MIVPHKTAVFINAFGSNEPPDRRRIKTGSISFAGRAESSRYLISWTKRLILQKIQLEQFCLN